MTDIKQYVNLDPSMPAELKELKPERAGRLIRVSAKIDQKVAGVPVVFEIISGSKNVYPSLDKSNFSKKELSEFNDIKKLLPGFQMPMKAKRKVFTDEAGVSETDFMLSGFGGDEYEVKAYVLKQGGENGKELLSQKYVVWRRIYYQVGRFKSGTVGANRNGTLPEVPNFDWSPVKTEFEARKHNIELVDDSRVDLVRRYKNIIEPVDPWDDLTYSVKDGYVPEREPVSVRVVLCNQIAEPRKDTIKPFIILDRKSIDIDVSSVGKLWLDESLPIGTDCILSADIEFYEGDSPRRIKDIFMYGVGPSTVRIRFDLMEPSTFEASFGKKPSRARLTLKLRLLNGSTNGLSWFNAVWLAHSLMHSQSTYSAGGKQSTAIHEIGHFVDMVSSRQKSWYPTRLPHKGDHCSTGLSMSDLTKPSYSGLNGTCVMFGEGDPFAKSANQFCGTCDPSVRESSVRNIARIKRWP